MLRFQAQIETPLGWRLAMIHTAEHDNHHVLNQHIDFRAMS